MSSKKIAIIGLGNIGKVVAQNLEKSKQEFIVAGNDLEKTKQIATTIAPSAKVTDITTAIKEADIVILPIPFKSIVPFIKEYATELEGKIVVDPSNPIAPDENGGFKKIIDEKTSAGQVNAAALPKGIKLAKALGTLGAGSLSTAAFQNPKNVLFYATDDTAINADIEQLIANVGFAAARAGGIDQSIRIEVFGNLHEFGALGKTITLEEAKSVI
ncbi:NAD(P)-binding domain-containing protein [Flavobacterium sp. LS1R49]|uniref:NAD(P)-binding domain-containing protein n=1 Tax=Flavobacterium shii TaxID=2987687 RepID=A0A9X2ZHD4_9FLAO|nr:NAD(P)-binding domain-containing protein [Flavobacterium shii]MCV9928697.1 NAD(P)-binding domain-containing protein [Flavobacterium shii]